MYIYCSCVTFCSGQQNNKYEDKQDNMYKGQSRQRGVF